MAERLPRNPESLPTPESMTEAMDFWLSEEIKSSMSGSNAYLDNMDTFIADGRAKAAGHYDRLELWTEQFSEDPTDMNALTMQLFGIQTGLSGAFRTQCYIVAKNGTDYELKRSSTGPLGIDISKEVNNRLMLRFGRIPTEKDIATNSFDTDKLITETKYVNDFRLRTFEKLHSDPRHKQGMRGLFYLMRLSRLQKDWLGLGIDYITYAAHINGGRLDNLEFLEPLPISQAQPYKPFAR